MKSAVPIRDGLEVNFNTANINKTLTKHEVAERMKPVLYQCGRSRYFLKLVFDIAEATVTAQIQCKCPKIMLTT